MQVTCQSIQRSHESFETLYYVYGEEDMGYLILLISAYDSDIAAFAFISLADAL